MPRVQVARADAAAQHVVEIDLPEGATLQQAAVASGLAAGFDPQTWGLGVFGERRDPASPVRAGERVEIYRPLPLDPREMRRRAAKAKS